MRDNAEICCTPAGIAPSKTSDIYSAKQRHAHGRFQMWFVRYHGGVHIDRVGRWLRAMYSALAVRMALAAILVPIFLIVPAIRILFNIWPIIINRYFGIGFFLYYCLGTPILYQVTCHLFLIVKQIG